jgi:hypothetical protein
VDLAASRTPSCPSTWAAYLVANGELRALPTGASLEGSAGRFYWQLGPGFAGRYRLVFVRTDCGGARHQVPIDVVITGDSDPSDLSGPSATALLDSR